MYTYIPGSFTTDGHLDYFQFGENTIMNIPGAPVEDKHAASILLRKAKLFSKKVVPLYLPLETYIHTYSCFTSSPTLDIFSTFLPFLVDV